MFEKNNTPNDGAESTFADSITKAVSKQDRIKMATEFLKKLYANVPPNTGKLGYLWVCSMDGKTKLTQLF